MSRRKRASMREGPLADLFRSTSDDTPLDPPEAPRYGREDPVESQRSAEETPPAPDAKRRTCRLVAKASASPTTIAI